MVELNIHWCRLLFYDLLMLKIFFGTYFCYICLYVFIEELISGAGSFGLAAVTNVRRLRSLRTLLLNLVKTGLKEAVIVDFLGNSSSVFTDTMADGSEGVAHRDKLLDNVSVFKLKVFVFRCSHDKPPVKDA